MALDEISVACSNILECCGLMNECQSQCAEGDAEEEGECSKQNSFSGVEKSCVFHPLRSIRSDDIPVAKSSSEKFSSLSSFRRLFLIPSGGPVNVSEN